MTSVRVGPFFLQSQSKQRFKDIKEDVTWYLAGGGFTGCFQSLGQLTGAVAGCGVQGAKMLMLMVTDESTRQIGQRQTDRQLY